MSWIKQLEAKLEGWPDELLTAALVAVAAGLVMVAILAPSLFKAVVLAWVVAP